MPANELEKLTKKLEDLRLESKRIDEEKTKIEKAIVDIKKSTKIALVGDRVRISNPTFSVYHNDIESDSIGTVTRVTDKRVCILTDNGEKTNRVPKNVSRI